jgi:DNA-binding NtrC family response regulator
MAANIARPIVKIILFRAPTSARQLGVRRSNLYRKVREMGIEVDEE